MQLTWEVQKSGVCFSLPVEGKGIAPDDWQGVAPAELYAPVLLLSELMANGQAEAQPEGILVPHAEVAALSSIDQQLLDLPPPYPFDIRIDAKGTLNNNDFAYDLGYYADVEGERFITKRAGCLLTLTGASYVLSPEHLELCDSIDAFNALPATEKTMVSNLRRFADIKALSAQAAAVLDRYLQNEEVVAPEKVTLDVKRDGDALEIFPTIEGENDFTDKFDRFPQVRGTYTFQDDEGRRRRVVFTEDQQEELKKAKAHRRVSGAVRDEIVENPQVLFDPDVVDLDAFGARVVEIGFYKPRFYPFISPYKSEWIPGFVVETSPEERTRVVIPTKDDLASFEEAQQLARSQGKDTVEWKGVSVPLEEAGRIAAMASRQLDSPKEPVGQEPGAGEQKVLIIKENIDELAYSEVPDAPTDETFEHRYTPPPHLKPGVRPRTHQTEGIAWLQSLSRRYPGALLADDMGLGKTFVVLSFLKWHASQPDYGGHPYLIVAPVSLLENWENEYNKFFQPSPPPVARLYGDTLRAMLGGGVPAGKQRLAKALQRSQLCLTTYETMRRQQMEMAAVDWAVVVVDEAQKIKTPGTLVTNAAKALQSNFKVAMTGTPVENTLIDLWCIMDFVVPGLLGSAKEFARQYQNRLDDPEVDVTALGEELRDRLGFYIKRRLKKDVLGELPSKHTHVRERTMPRAQRDRYLMEVQQAQEAKASDASSGHEVLRALHAMRAISDHPYLLERRLDKINVDELIATSAKLQETVEVLETIREQREKVILFAERRETQRMLATVLHRVFDLKVSIINGDTPAGKRSGRSSKLSRQQTIDQFEGQAGFGAIVMSPLAAGVGLNVTAANHVIHYSRHWNPAKEDQATDRAYRIGQERDVHVYYPMATLPDFKSFDVILDELLQRKRALADASLFPTERVEVRPDELYASVFGGTSMASPSQPLTMQEVDTLDAHLFEALVASLWKAQGYRVVLTPRSHDRGADVACFSDGGNMLLQVKQSMNSIGQAAVQEVTAARGYYEKVYDVAFEGGVVTNAWMTPGAHQLARANGVYITERSKLEHLLGSSPTPLSNVVGLERQRLGSLP